jgi:2-C-methyl-D-erythritol 4-phosphate cytidylyltransferase
VNFALILAGGQGERMGETHVPKQFIEICGKPVIFYTFESIQRNINIDCACVVAPSSWHATISEWVKDHGFTKVSVITNSGVDRQSSVHSGLKALFGLPQKPSIDDNVMIMTAVCPFVAQDTINQHFEEVREHGGCITVVSAVDAITYSNDGKLVNRTLQKHKMFVQQGPQTFKLLQLLKAHDDYVASQYHAEVNEDSELILNMGCDVAMVIGDRFCLKVTYPEDIAIVEALAPLFEAKENCFIEGKHGLIAEDH